MLEGTVYTLEALLVADAISSFHFSVKSQLAWRRRVSQLLGSVARALLCPVTAAMEEEKAIVQDENLRLAELLFQARHGDSAAAAELKACLIDRKALCFLRTASTALVR